MTDTAQVAYLNDIGTAIRLTIKDQDGNIIDVSGSTVRTLKCDKPGTATNISRNMVFFTDGSDGIVEYITIDGDLDTIGLWELQAYVEMPGGKWHTAETTMRVKPVLEVA